MILNDWVYLATLLLEKIMIDTPKLTTSTARLEDQGKMSF